MSSPHILPDELLVHIFSLMFPRADEDYLWVEPPNPANSLLLLGCVSRRFRAISQASSELWTSLEIRITNTSLAFRVLEGVEHWLDRAQGRPLWLAISQETLCKGVGDPFIAIFFRSFAQVQTLYLAMSGRWDAPWQQPAFAARELPLLEGINTSFNLWQYVQWFRPVFDARLPALRRLIMPKYVRAWRCFTHCSCFCRA